MSTTRLRERVLPVVTGDAKIQTLPDRLEYAVYWKRRKQNIESLIADVGTGAFSSETAYREYDQYYRRVFNNLDKLLSMLSDCNALTPTLLEESGVEVLLAEIDKRLYASGAEAP